MSQTNLLLESSKYAPLNESDKAIMSIMLESANAEQQKLINEGTLSGDVAQFTPILLPLVRRVYPNLIANQLLGVQAMPLPTGYIYALTNQYLGTDNNKANPNSRAQILNFAAEQDDLVEGVTLVAGSVTGTVLYTEGTKVLVSVDGTTGPVFKVTDVITWTDPDSNTGDTDAVTGVFTNEAAFGAILKGYTGSYTTAEAEKLGKDMREVGFTINRKNVEAKSRALKGQYSVEMYQDLKSQHGLLADEEIMSLMGYEVQAEIDREVVDFVNSNATQLANTFDVSFSTTADGISGRWEIEKFRREASRFNREAAQIGVDTKRGQGNTLLVSPGVAAMLEEVGTFTPAPVPSNLSTQVSGGVAGTFNNKFKVIVDQYATSDYATVLYKGNDRRDAMGFFAPHVPLSFTRVTHADSGQPAIIAKTRYALATIPGAASAESNDRAKTYARSFGIDLDNTALAASKEA